MPWAAWSGIQVSILRVGVLAALVSVVACADLSPGEELSEARTRWRERGPMSYRITIRRECECHDEAIGPVVVSVRNGVAEWTLYQTDTTFVDPALSDRVPSVEGLFRMIDEAVQQRAQVLDVRYDRDLGYPLMIFINDNPAMPDGDVRTIVMSLVAQ